MPAIRQRVFETVLQIAEEEAKQVFVSTFTLFSISLQISLHRYISTSERSLTRQRFTQAILERPVLLAMPSTMILPTGTYRRNDRANIGGRRKVALLEERLNSLIKQIQTSHSPGLPSPISTCNNTALPSNQGSALQERHIILEESLEASQKESANGLRSGPVAIPATYNCHGPSHCICKPIPGQAPGPTNSDEVLLRIYREELFPVYPFVVIPEEMTATELQTTRPFLMASIRLVASFRSLRSMQGQLYQLMSYVSDRVLMQSERSIDLLSGMVVILSWHNRQCYLHAQLQNLVSLSVTLAGALGLKRAPSWQERTTLMVMNLGKVRERTNEERRLLLAVWHLSSWYVSPLRHAGLNAILGALLHRKLLKLISLL